MKPYFLKLALGMAGLAAIAIAPALLAADVTTIYSGYAPSSHVPLEYWRSNSVAASPSNVVMVALNAETFLLKELLQDHQSRAAELTRKNETEKAKWEMELVNELREKAGRVQKSIDQMSQPGAAAGEVDDQLVFVSTLEAHLEQIHQELSAALGDSQILSMQIATNKAPEDIPAISLALGDNQRLVKELQREQLDLELRKLEFRAMRKLMPK